MLEKSLANRKLEQRKVVPFRRSNSMLCEAGGPIDEINVTLAIYSEELQPDAITRALGIQPTRAHRQGDRAGPKSPPFRTGAWLLTEHGRDAESAEIIIERLLKQLPEDVNIWRELRIQHTIQLRFGLHMTGWNKGLSIPLPQVTRIAEFGADMELDIYAYGEDE
jgi:hypothetical protein